MMEFDREQIIKAFECCHTLSSDCLSCPFLEDSKACASVSLMALALIKKLVEENKTLRGLYEHNSQLAIDSERKLEQCKKSYEDELSRAYMLLADAWESVDKKDRLLEIIKTSTVRKMQERLKEYLDDFYTTDEDALLDVPDLIDQIAREALEEDKSYSWVITENGCVITCPNCGERLELCYPDGTEVRYLPHCPWCGKQLNKGE